MKKSGPNTPDSFSQLTLPFTPHQSLDGEDFLEAPCNGEALAWIDRWPDWPGPALAVVGPAGSGKSHLARVWAAKCNARFIGIDDLADIIESGDMDTPVVFDDADRSMGNAHSEQMLFHFLNHIQTLRGMLLLTGNSAPARWSVQLPDLASRLGAIGVAEIGLPDDGLMGPLLVKLFSDRQVHVSAEVINFLAARMERSFDAARRLVAAADARALAEGRAVTVPLVRELLAPDSD
ncbi:MAG: HdaA/DnaA family protein [Alphaproteobacteria bacterium]